MRNKGKEGKNRQENISNERDIKTTLKIRRRKREREKTVSLSETAAFSFSS